MKLIDPHLHLEGLSNDSLQLMAMAGIKKIVGMISIPEVVPAMNMDFPPEAIFAYVDRVLEFGAWMTKQYFMIDTYVCAGVSMVGVPLRYKEALKGLSAFLQEKKQVVGIGEIGFEPSSPTCSDLKIQEEIIQFQLDLAKKLGKVVCFHTPPKEKVKWTERYLAMIKEAHLDQAQVVIDHSDGTNVRTVVNAGCYAGITVQPHRHVRAIEAAEIISTSDRTRIIVDSDTSILNESDPLAVARTAFELRKMGMAEKEIEQVLWDNPRRVYNLS